MKLWGLVLTRALSCFPLSFKGRTPFSFLVHSAFFSLLNRRAFFLVIWFDSVRARIVSSAFMNSSALAIDSYRLAGVFQANSAIIVPLAYTPLRRDARMMFSTKSSTVNFSLLNRSMQSLRDSNSLCFKVSKFAGQLHPAMSWVKKNHSKSSKLPTDFDGRLANHLRAAPLRVKGKALQAISYIWDPVKDQMRTISFNVSDLVFGPVIHFNLWDLELLR